MTTKVWVAAAIAFASWSAQGATSLGQLPPGVSDFSVSFANTSGLTFNEQLTFSLGADSRVKGLLFGQGDSVNLLSVSIQRFSESGNAPVVSVTPKPVGDGFAFDLGDLSVPSGIGFDSSLYTLSLSGVRGTGATGLSLALNVTAVPESATWSLMALGLVGLAGVRRAQARPHAEA